jgi:hypothetical protein
MPVYRFEITRGDTTEARQVECESAEIMREKAFQIAKHSIGDLEESFWAHPRWAIRVTDDSNMTILCLTFSAD